MDKIISDTQLEPYLTSPAGGFGARLQAFIRQQCATWPALAEARAALADAVTRYLRLPDSEIVLQCNPGRAKSVSAKVAPGEVAARPCFLCPDNLYPEQLGLPFQEGWLILNNPFPIFRDHLVISSRRHCDQQALPALAPMISFVAESGCSFSTFYNGASCGASAPDHLHFQACPAGRLPLEEQVLQLEQAQASGGTRWWFGMLDGRGTGVCSAPSADALHTALQAMLAHLGRLGGQSAEPLLNLIISGRAGRFVGICLPRRAHRPACFFATGEHKRVISPGAVDVAGLVILPRQEDYERLSAEDLLQIYREVCADAGVFEGAPFGEDR